ncbi:hypothetical protein E4U52_004052 [Claviceps spartinae]|nr:hypothetical protein E4U52_004052 [Claviceps spartinae]
MVSVAEKFGNLRDTLGPILGIFTLMRWIRTLIAKITGRPPPANALALTPAAFTRFEGRNTVLPDGTLPPPEPGDLVAVLAKKDPAGQPSDWWECRARDGRQGYLPSTYLEVLKRPGQEVKAIKAPPGDVNGSSVPDGMLQEGEKYGMTADGMQRSHFYS